MKTLNPCLPADFRRLATRSRMAVGLALLSALVASCTDDPTGANGVPTQIAGQTPGTLAQQQPATPPPTAIASPRPSGDLSGVATPTPLVVPSPSMPPSPSPAASLAPGASPTSGAGLSPSPTASTSPDPNASPTPSPSPSFNKTGTATDLAVSGPGYFVLSTKAEPTAIGDLYFTRYGRFSYKLDSTSPSQQRLKHSDGAFFLLGYSRIGASAGAGTPTETTGVNEAVLTTSWGTASVGVRNLAVDAARNPEAGAKTTFDTVGLFQINAVDPYDADAVTRLTKYVVIAQFPHPEFLSAVPGYDDVYRFNDNAGPIYLGVPGGSGPVGHANLIIPSTLEVR